MKPIATIPRSVGAFLAYVAKDDPEAFRYKAVLDKAGFGTYVYESSSPPGDPFFSTIRREIEQACFFCLLVSPASRRARIVPRELGYALSVLERTQHYQPLIIPIYVEPVESRTGPTLPSTFPVRDFHTNAALQPYRLDQIRGFDRHGQPQRDADEILIQWITPKVLVSRVDLTTPEEFFEKGVVALYESIFPEVERDDPLDMIDWVLYYDTGENKYVEVDQSTTYTYWPDSRFFVLEVCQKAVGLAFFCYDNVHRMIYGNYIAVEKHWRTANMAGAFLETIWEMFPDLFPSYRGVIFEVETYDLNIIRRAIDALENYKRTLLVGAENKGLISQRLQHQLDAMGADELNELRKFRRVIWYQFSKLRCRFFIDVETNEPLTCTAPCLAPSLPREKWRENEETYWIMWRDRQMQLGTPTELWRDAVQCVYDEILVKSLVDRYPVQRKQYWDYAQDIIRQNMEKGERANVVLAPFDNPEQKELRSRWMALNLELAI